MIVAVSVAFVLLLLIISMLYYRFLHQLRMRQLEAFEKIIQAQESERTRIARDLHDELAPVLSSVRLRLDECDSPAEVMTERDVLSRDIAESINRIREISHNLMPSTIINLGLVQTVNDMLRENRNNGIMIDFSCTIDDKPLTNFAKINIYRIISELVQNARKHSKATEIRLQLEDNGGSGTRLVYKDNGQGLQETARLNGLGMENMKARAQLLGGDMTIEQPVKGTSIIFYFDAFKIKL